MTAIARRRFAALLIATAAAGGGAATAATQSATHAQAMPPTLQCKLVGGTGLPGTGSYVPGQTDPYNC